jgi:uncharacterized protein (TIGR02246 family)
MWQCSGVGRSDWAPHDLGMWSVMSLRPALALDDTDTLGAVEALEHLVDELQAGWDKHDADTTDASLAADVLWGSPFGATLRGYDDLHEIHVRLKQDGVGGPSSRFEIVQYTVPSPDIVIAHVRRLAVDAAGRALAPTTDTTGPFSEVALYVLVHRDGAWWLAAGHNTPIRPGPAH